MAELATFDLVDPAATSRFGRRLASFLFPGAVIGLVGPLGAGKTFLVRAIAEGLGVADSRVVSSPTFVLIHEYLARLPIYHFDVYRLKTPAEFPDLAASEYFEREGVCLVEWADRVQGQLPAEHALVRLDISGEDSRRLTMEGRGERHEALVSALRSSWGHVSNLSS